MWCVPFQSCLCTADSLNYPKREERTQLDWRCERRNQSGNTAALTMLLWCALVINSIRPTRSVVETPWVLLHSLQRHGCTEKLSQIRLPSPPGCRIITGRVQINLTCIVLTSSPPHMCPSHPLLVLYHLKWQHIHCTISRTQFLLSLRGITLKCFFVCILVADTDVDILTYCVYCFNRDLFQWKYMIDWLWHREWRHYAIWPRGPLAEMLHLHFCTMKERTVCSSALSPVY